MPLACLLALVKSKSIRNAPIHTDIFFFFVRLLRVEVERSSMSTVEEKKKRFDGWLKDARLVIALASSMLPDIVVQVNLLRRSIEIGKERSSLLVRKRRGVRRYPAKLHGNNGRIHRKARQTKYACILGNQVKDYVRCRY